MYLGEIFQLACNNLFKEKKRKREKEKTLFRTI